MQNREEWKPSRFVYKNGKLIGSRDATEVSETSRLVTDIIADFYDRAPKRHAKGRRLLDLGCGKGPFYAAYRELMTDSICVDWAGTRHKNRYFGNEPALPTRVLYDCAKADLAAAERDCNSGIYAVPAASASGAAANAYTIRSGAAA